jgi:hypothetical protein
MIGIDFTNSTEHCIPIVAFDCKSFHLYDCHFTYMGNIPWLSPSSSSLSDNSSADYELRASQPIGKTLSLHQIQSFKLHGCSFMLNSRSRHRQSTVFVRTIQGGEIVIHSTIFANNTGVNGISSGITLIGAANVTVVNCTFIGNVMSHTGLTTSTDLVLPGALFITSMSGSGRYGGDNSSSITLMSSSFVNNEVYHLISSDTDRIIAGAAVTFGVELIDSIIISDCYFDHNVVQAQQVPIACSAVCAMSSTIPATRNLRITRTSFINNMAFGRMSITGGSLYVTITNHSSSMHDVHFINNTIQGQGLVHRGLSGAGSTVSCPSSSLSLSALLDPLICSITITHSTWINNAISTIGNSPSIDGGVAGAGLFISSASGGRGGLWKHISILSCHFESNYINTKMVRFLYVAGAGLSVIAPPLLEGGNNNHDNGGNVDGNDKMDVSIVIQSTSFISNLIVTHREQPIVNGCGLSLISNVIASLPSTSTVFSRGIGNILLKDLIFTDNMIVGGGSIRGGGAFIMLDDHTIITNNIFHQNRCVVPTMPLLASGGGIYALCASPLGCGMDMHHNEWIENHLLGRAMDSVPPTLSGELSGISLVHTKMFLPPTVGSD